MPTTGQLQGSPDDFQVVAAGRTRTFLREAALVITIEQQANLRQAISTIKRPIAQFLLGGGGFTNPFNGSIYLPDTTDPAGHRVQ